MSAGDGRGKAERLLPIVLALALPAAAVCLYLPTLGAEFVYDARAQVLRDDYIHDPGNLPEVLGFDEDSLAEVLETIQTVFKDEISHY